MRFTNSAYLDKLFEILLTYHVPKLDELTLCNIVRSIGTYAYVNQDVIEIIRKYKDVVLDKPSLKSI